MDAGPDGMDGRVIMEAGFVDRSIPDARIDPFDPDASCGRAIVETTRLPGSLLFVFDRSGSMDASPVEGELTPPTRWSVAGDAVRAVLDATPDEMNVGMLLFPPSGEMCSVAGVGVPQVPIAPLSTSRAAIAAHLLRIPDGVATPIFGALRAGWDHLGTLGARGQRALVLVTDGRENCQDDERDAVVAQATVERVDNGHLTFVIGLTQSNSDLSTLALDGGTRRNDTCLADCTTPACVIDADTPCPDTGADCATFPDGETGGTRAPGFCGCITAADCPPPMTCEIDAGGQSVCVGVPNCCHYNASEATFATDFRAALDAIADEIIDTCIFDLPRGDPTMFDPMQVNVRVTIDAGAPEVLGRSSDPTIDSWDYTSPDQESIVIQGPLCDRIREGTATVEIVLGCATILI